MGEMGAIGRLMNSYETVRVLIYKDNPGTVAEQRFAVTTP